MLNASNWLNDYQINRWFHSMWTHFEMEVLSSFYFMKAILSIKAGKNWSRLSNRASSSIKCWLSHISKGSVQMQLYRKNSPPKSWSKMGNTLLWFEPELNDRRNRVSISLRLPNNLFEEKFSAKRDLTTTCHPLAELWQQLSLINFTTVIPWLIVELSTISHWHDTAHISSGVWW